MKECIQCSREALSGGAGKLLCCQIQSQADKHDYLVDPAVIPAVSSILRNLLTSIATFWGESELVKVIELCLDSSQSSALDASEMSLLVRTVAKRASPNVLLPALCNMWTRTLSLKAKVSVLILSSCLCMILRPSLPGSAVENARIHPSGQGLHQGCVTTCRVGKPARVVQDFPFDVRLLRQLGQSRGKQ